MMSVIQHHGTILGGAAMKWLKKLFGGGVLDTEAVMDRSLQLLREGEAVEAISQMQSAVDAVKASAGNPSCEYAKGLFNLAMLHISAGDMAQGAEDCRLAADSCPDSAAGRKDRLMYLMNAGQLLSRAGEPDVAIEVLETSLRERHQAYGPDHAGTAYGQQALADVYLSAGRFAEGLELAEQALKIFYNENHHEYPSALASTTALASASGLTDQEVWGYATEDSRGIAGQVVDSAMLLAEAMPGKTGMNYLRQLADWAEKYMPPDAPPMMNVVALWSNIASEHGDAGERRMVVDRAIETAHQLGDPAIVVNAIEGRALTLSQIGCDADEVRASYEQALSHAKEHDLDSEAAGVLRNWAIYESEIEDTEAAALRFQQAIERAQNSSDEEILARTQIAFGIFHQHNGDNELAVPLLESGIDGLDPMHPDVSCGMLHQVALSENLSCPCNGNDEIAKDAIGLLAERFFAKSGLDDIIQSVTFGPDEKDDSESLKVELSRQPSHQELQRLQIAHGVFQNLLSSRGYQ